MPTVGAAQNNVRQPRVKPTPFRRIDTSEPSSRFGCRLHPRSEEADASIQPSIARKSPFHRLRVPVAAFGNAELE
jgi:hypothetical protein